MNKLLREEHHNSVVERLRSLMTNAKLDALVVFRNANFTYVNTLPSVFLNLVRRPGIAMLFIPRDGDLIGICPDFERPELEAKSMVKNWREFPLWVYIDDQFLSPDEVQKKEREKKERTENVDESAGQSIQVLVEVLKSLGVDHGCIGVEIPVLTVPFSEGLKNLLPHASLVDSTQISYSARAVKTPYEVECLRESAQKQEKVVFETMAEIQIGTSHADMMSMLKSRALAMDGIDSIRFMVVSLGPKFAPCLEPYDAFVEPGDLIKYDGALNVRGYAADAARTFIAGEASTIQEKINDALVKAHKEALNMCKPGALPKDIFNRAMQVVKKNGFPNYMRSHIGHSIGLDLAVEEPPYLSRTNENPLVPGNVFCVELPYYAHNFGSIMNEDLVHITEDGAELLTTAEHKLHPIGKG